MNLLKKTLINPVQSVILQIPRALVASVLAAALDCGLLILLVEFCGWRPIPATVVGYLAGGVVQYVLCALWVFSAAPASNTLGFGAFTVLSLVGLLITWAAMSLIHDFGGFPYTLAKVVALALAFNWNFFSRKYLLFSPTPRKTPKISQPNADPGSALDFSSVYQ